MMTFRQADRIVLDEVLGNTASLPQILDDVIVLKARVNAVLALLSHAPATRISLQLPMVTRKGTDIMADFPLQNDKVYTVPIVTLDAAGGAVPAPQGDTFTVTSASASLGAAMGQTASGAPAVVLTPMVQAGTGYEVDVSDSAGLSVYKGLFDIVPDVAPMAVSLDTADATTIAQAVPTNPGP